MLTAFRITRFLSHSSFSQLLDGQPQRFSHSVDLHFIAITLARPEKTLETVMPAAGHNVNVKVGNALAYSIVDSY
jgi:hypothetical protein